MSANTGIGNLIRAALVEEGDVKDVKAQTKRILQAVFEVYPEANTTEKCVAWYRSELRQRGLLSDPVRLAPEVRAANKKRVDQEWRARRREKFAAEKAERLAAKAAAQSEA